MVVRMEPNRLTSAMWRKSSKLLHSISAQSEIPALFTTAHRPDKRKELEFKFIKHYIVFGSRLTHFEGGGSGSILNHINIKVKGGSKKKGGVCTHIIMID